MAAIEEAKLKIEKDNRTQIAHVRVTCKINFTSLENNLMKSYPEDRWFKVKCKLRGQDWPDADDHLFTMPKVIHFPDASPTDPEPCVFEADLGFGVLNEDLFSGDEVYGRIYLYNLLTGQTKSKDTPVVTRWF